MPSRSHIALSLLVLLLVQAAGPFLFFEGRRHFARREMKRVLKAQAPASMLCTITLPADRSRHGQSRVQWIDEKEFRRDGRMFDVVRAVPRGDSIVYTCIEDERETVLFAGLDALIRGHINGDATHKAAEARIQRVLGQPFLAVAGTVAADLVHIGMMPEGSGEDAPEWTPRPASPPPKA